MGTLSSGQRDTESGSSQNNQEDREGSNGLKTKFTKKDSRSACNLRDTDDRSPYTLISCELFEQSLFISRSCHMAQRLGCLQQEGGVFESHPGLIFVLFAKHCKKV